MELAVSEHSEIRNPAHIESRRHFRRSLRIHLEHHRLASQLARHLRHLRRSHPARPAPRRPEIHQHRNPALANHLVELLCAYLDRLTHRGQRRFTRATFAHVSKMLRRNSIRLPAGQATPEDGHSELLVYSTASPA